LVGHSLYRFCCSLAGKLQALLAVSQLSFFSSTALKGSAALRGENTEA
jgi:hypothetical protein